MSTNPEPASTASVINTMFPAGLRGHVGNAELRRELAKSRGRRKSARRRGEAGRRPALRAGRVRRRAPRRGRPPRARDDGSAPRSGKLTRGCSRPGNVRPCSPAIRPREGPCRLRRAARTASFGSSSRAEDAGARSATRFAIAGVCPDRRRDGRRTARVRPPSPEDARPHLARAARRRRRGSTSRPRAPPPASRSAANVVPGARRRNRARCARSARRPGSNLPPELLRYVVEKGSITLDGCSPHGRRRSTRGAIAVALIPPHAGRSRRSVRLAPGEPRSTSRSTSLAEVRGAP